MLLDNNNNNDKNNKNKKGNKKKKKSKKKNKPLKSEDLYIAFSKLFSMENVIPNRT